MPAPSGWLGDSPGVEVERETAATDIVQPTRLAQALGCLMLAPQQFKRLVEENAELHEKLKEALVSVDELSEQVQLISTPSTHCSLVFFVFVL
jgi:hypothetical protein